MRALWLLVVRVLFAVAGQTNHSIDDASGLVNYLGSKMLCIGCNYWVEGGEVLDVSSAHNGTVSLFSDAAGAMEFKFIGNALYIFLVVPNVPILVAAKLNFSLDGVQVGSRLQATSAATEYNISAYTNTSIMDGAHTFRMDVSAGAADLPILCVFDYAVYTSNDPTPSSTSNTQPVTSSSKRKPSVGAIVGAVVGAVAAIIISAVGVILVRRTPRSKRQDGRSTMADLESTSTEALDLSKGPIAPPTPAEAKPPPPAVSKEHTPVDVTDAPSPVEPRQSDQLTAHASQEETSVAEQFRVLR
ncbi:hypothetical protein C8R47DRAFT_1145417 [Mycena vitilis]|nr:hypothetical protein C8R47DRAFT_1145417 [Mycena vitilis]